MSGDQNSKAYRPLRSITRLLMGGVILASEALQDRLQIWGGDEDEVTILPENSSETEHAGESEIILGEVQLPKVFNPLPDELPPPGMETPRPMPSVDLRYALIGLIFEGEEQLERGLKLTRRVGEKIGRVLDPIFQPITQIPNPAAKPLKYLVQRGQSEVDRWVERGRDEEVQSRHMAQGAAITTVDESITYMARNPALEELIQTQSVSLARQILDLIRGDAVSADYFFEDLVRYALRRKPRYLLAPPNPEVQKQATWTLQDIRHEDLNGNE